MIKRYCDICGNRVYEEASIIPVRKLVGNTVVGGDVYPVIKIINEEVDLCDSCRSVIADCMNYLVMIKRKMTNKCTKGAPV